MEFQTITKVKLFPDDLRDLVVQALAAKGYEVKGGLSPQVFANFQLEFELVKLPALKDKEEIKPSTLYKELTPAMDKEERKRENQRVAYAKWRDKQNAKKQAERETKPPEEQALLAKRAPLAQGVAQQVSNELSAQIAADIKELKAQQQKQEPEQEPEVVAPTTNPFLVSELLLTLNQSS